MNNTTDYPPLTQAEIETIDRADAEHDWLHGARARMTYIEVLLDRISYDIETVPAHSREHAADLLDAAIELLERLNSRFSPAEPEQEPPF